MLRDREALERINIRTITPKGVAPTAASAKAACESCGFRKLCLAGALERSELESFAKLAKVTRKVRRGAALFRAGDAFESLHVVRSGTFKKAFVSRDGREKVTGFYYTGDVLGLDAIDGRVHRSDAIALEDAQVCVIPYRALEHLALALPRLQQQLFSLLSADIARDQGLMLLLGRMSAEERVAAFLLNVSRSYQLRGYASNDFILRMTRAEIGSYLGLTLETVSRVTTRFQSEGLLRAHNREIRLLDAERLRERTG